MRNRLTERETAAALGVPCPRCGAPPNRGCTRGDTRVYSPKEGLHVIRWKKANGGRR
jgi:hypothetical protein